MNKLTEEDVLLRVNRLKDLFDQKYTREKILKNFKDVPKGWFVYIRKYNIQEFHECKYCKTTKNLIGTKRIINICKACYNKHDVNNMEKILITVNKKSNKKAEISVKRLQELFNLGYTKKEILENFKDVKERWFNLIKKYDIKVHYHCHDCGATENLYKSFLYGNEVVHCICNKCYSQKFSKHFKQMWDSFTDEFKEIRIKKIQEKRQVTIDNWTDKQWDNFSDAVSKGLKEFNSSEYGKIVRKNHGKIIGEIIKNKSEEEKLQIKKKKQNTWSNKTEEEIINIVEKTFNTKIERNILTGKPGGFDKKAQDLFWFLEDNISKNYIKRIRYATKETRDVDNIKNDEFIIGVFKVSKTQRNRRLDFYLKLINGFQINIEFDPIFHNNNIDEDFERELEILQVLKNIIILRIRQDIYLNNKEKIQNEILSIILKINETNNFTYNDIPVYYLPLLITNNNKVINEDIKYG